MAAATASACSRDAAIANNGYSVAAEIRGTRVRSRPVIVQIRSGGLDPTSNGPWPRAAPARDAGTPSRRPHRPCAGRRHEWPPRDRIAGCEIDGNDLGGDDGGARVCIGEPA